MLLLSDSSEDTMFARNNCPCFLHSLSPSSMMDLESVESVFACLPSDTGEGVTAAAIVVLFPVSVVNIAGDRGKCDILFHPHLPSNYYRCISFSTEHEGSTMTMTENSPCIIKYFFGNGGRPACRSAPRYFTEIAQHFFGEHGEFHAFSCQAFRAKPRSLWHI